MRLRSHGLLYALILLPLGASFACGTTLASAGSGGAPVGTGATATVGSGGAGEPASGGGGASDSGTAGSGLGGVESRLAGTDGYDCSAPSGEVPALELTTIAEGLEYPSLVVHAPNDSRLFIVLQGGVIRVYEDGALVEEPFLDIADRVASYADDDGADNGDRGLNGLAFHPNFAQNGLFYLHYNAMSPESPYPTGTTIIAEYQVDPDSPNLADEFSEHVLLSIDHPHTDHNGGTIAFGLDRLLYIALGDGDGGRGTAVDPGQTGQNPADLFGSVLRIGVADEPGQPYLTPSGNLKDENPAAAPEVWSYGLRNPFRMNFDACTGALYIGDVGYETSEEIDLELPGQAGRNYGWPIFEGANCLAESCEEEGLAAPLLTYQHPGPSTENPGAVIGGAVYRGSAIPALRGTYFYADHYLPYADHEIWSTRVEPSTGVASAPVARTDDLNPAENDLGITSIQNGPDGELYFTAYTAGAVYRLGPE